MDGDNGGAVNCCIFLIFAGTTSDFCWNQFSDLLQQERGGHGGGRHDFLLHKIFAGTSFLIAATGEDGVGAATAAMP